MGNLKHRCLMTRPSSNDFRVGKVLTAQGIPCGKSRYLSGWEIFSELAYMGNIGKYTFLNSDLPYGWERKIQEDGTVFFVE